MSHFIRVKIESPDEHLPVGKDYSEHDDDDAVSNWEIPSLGNTKKARKRSATFTQQEVAILLEQVHQHRAVLLGGNKGKKDTDTKCRRWQAIAKSMVPSSPCGLRDWKGVRKKWQDLCNQTKNKAVNIRREGRATGGGGGEPDKTCLTPDEERVIAIVGKRAAGWVNGGIDVLGEMGLSADDHEPPVRGATAAQDDEQPSASGAAAGRPTSPAPSNGSMPDPDSTPPPPRPRRQHAPAGRTILMRAGGKRPSLVRCTCSEALMASEREKLGVLRRVEAHLQMSNAIQQEMLSVKREKLELQRRQLALAEARSVPTPISAPLVLPQDPDFLAVCKEEVSPEQQERNSSLVQEEPETPQVSEEPKEELLQRPGEADVSTMALLAVKSEDEEDENGETEPLACTSTEDMNTQANAKCWVASQPTSDVQFSSSPCYESNTEDSDVAGKSKDGDGNGETAHQASTSTEHVLMCFHKLMCPLHQLVKTQADACRGKPVEDCGASQPSIDVLLSSSPCSESDTDDSDDWASHRSEFDIKSGDEWKETDNVKSHVRSHTGEKFTCTTCGKVCNRKDVLKIHMKTHTGEKPFTCKVCGKGCSQKSGLKQHMRTHTGETPFMCTFCGKGYIQKSALKQHVMTHTGEKPLTCSICGKGCNQIGELRTHMRTHTGEMRYTCTVCGKSCRLKTNLEKHMRTHTGKSPLRVKLAAKAVATTVI